MKKWGNDTWRAGAILLLCLFLFASAAWAETDVTTMVKINPGRLLYDRLTKESYLDVSLTNISQAVLLTPVKVVIDSVSPSTVTVANADGVTDDGKPYLSFTTPTGQLLAGATTVAKKLSFANPAAVRFTYTMKVLAELPDITESVGLSGGSVTVSDQADPAAEVTVEFPAGALEAPKTITMLTSAPVPEELPAIPVGPVISLCPSGIFQEPVTVKVKYTDSQFDQSHVVDEASLKIYTLDEATGVWLPLENQDANPENNIVSATTTHFSKFTVMGNTLIGGDPRMENGSSPIMSDYKPVLFIHGVNVGSSVYGNCKITFGKAIQSLYDAAHDVDNGKGLNVYQFNYDTSDDIKKTAASLSLAIGKIRAETGGEPFVNIIAHSMGGLVARAYLENMAVAAGKSYPYNNDIGKLLMLGTPNHGALAGAIPALKGYESGEQMLGLDDGNFLQELNSGFFSLDPNKIMVHVAYGDAGLGENDYVVSVTSAKLSPDFTSSNFRKFEEVTLEGYAHTEMTTPNSEGEMETVKGIAMVNTLYPTWHKGYQLMHDFAFDGDSDGIADVIYLDDKGQIETVADFCPSTPLNQTAYGHGCSEEQFGQMIPVLEFPRKDEHVRIPASGDQETIFQWQPIIKDRLGALGEKYCLVVKEDDTLGGHTIWDGCNGISEEPYFSATTTRTLPPTKEATFGRFKPGMRYWWTVFAAVDEYDNWTNRDLVEWRTFTTYSDYVFSSNEGQEDYYDESREYQSVFSINSNLLSEAMPADSDLYRYLLATANESGSIVEDDGRTLISYWYDSTWGDNLGQDSSFNTVYDVDPGPDADGMFEVVSAGDEEGSQRGTYNTNAYYFSYDAINDSIGSAVTLTQWVDYLQAVRDQYQPIDRLTIFTHGNYGLIHLSDNAALTYKTVSDPNHEHYKQLKRLKDEGILAPDAHILLFSCLVAGDDAGKKLVQKIAELTGAYVHANSEYTGNVLPASELWVRYNKNEPGNDWDLNIECDSSGCIDKATYKMLDLPAKGAINVGPDNIDFLWKVVPNATSYCFNLKDANTATLIWDNTNGCGADDNFLRTSLEYGKEYQWRVQAFDAAGKLVQSSEWWSFSTGPLALAPRLPDTGQTVCYNNSTSIPCPKPGEPFFGQDANYTINPPAYTDHGNGTVTDNVTGLMWQQGDYGSTNWYKASGTVNSSYNPTGVDVCGDLTLAGYTDWRLPTKKELVGLVDYSRPYPGLTINTTYFPNTKQSTYWSSSTYASSPSNAWYVDFYNGSVDNYGKNNSYYVRCVRDGQ